MQRQSSLVLAGNEKIFRGPKTLRLVAQALPLARGLAKKHQKCANFAHQDSKGYLKVFFAKCMGGALHY